MEGKTGMIPKEGRKKKAQGLSLSLFNFLFFFFIKNKQDFLDLFLFSMVQN